ncbi:hypothetical protein VPNG_02217 [Cytospora leucostoma]|uniref:Ribonuclease H n=1 Tax=Cytospora leucostoma TaxID=1230097 RepID=A0A423XH99_9PEZI|nr:hypothetical protein VPNG_02217 [Cytospora leucostoma]
MGQWAFYAVQKGRQPGVYQIWSECEAQIRGFSGARFKGYQTREGAEDYVRGGTDLPGAGGASGVKGPVALGSVPSTAPVAARSVNAISRIATLPSSSSQTPASSAPVRGMIGLSSEVLSSLLNINSSTPPATSANGLSTTAPPSSSAAPSPSSSTPAKRSINGLSAIASRSPAVTHSPKPTVPARSSINGLSTPASQFPAAVPSSKPTAPARGSINGLSAAAAALSTLPSSSPSSRFYAVAVGRQPGVYLTWTECEAQVKGVRGAVYKSFADRAGAVEFVAVHGGDGGGHFSQFEGEGFKPDSSAPFVEEFGRLSSSQGWVPGSQEYKKQRARAMRNELRSYYFKSEPAVVAKVEGDGHKSLALAAIEKAEDGTVIKQEKGEDSKANPAIKKEEDEPEPYDEIRNEQELALLDLQGFQRMCREVGKEPADSIEGCRMALKETLVNIVDFIDVHRTGQKIEVWTDFEAFARYTLRSNKDKMIHKEYAKDDSLLECFLVNFAEHRAAAMGVGRPPSRKRRSAGQQGRDSKRMRRWW